MKRKRYGISLTKKISRLDWSFLYVRIDRLATTKGVTMSKYLTYEERLEIQQGLKNQLSFGKIAISIGKDRTTVSKEIKKYAFEQKTGYSSYPYNACIHRKTCNKKNICPLGCSSTSKYKCSICNKCNDFCDDFKEEVCSHHTKPPYVCNGCEQLNQCTLKKLFYHAQEAHLRCREHISDSRSGILCNELDLERINALVTPLVKNGQSIHQIYESNRDELMCSEKTLYNYIDACLLDVRNIDLPRKVKYRPRYKKPEFKVDRACRNGRTYKDFQAFMEKHPDATVVQMDSVCGNQGGKVLLTIHFVATSFMLAFIRDANTARSVTEIFDLLYRVLGHENFTKLFPVILTDNGSEFSDPLSIEFGPDRKSRRRTYVFYCDPSSPHQKGACEVNHELIRRIVPKGKSFDDYTQDDIFLMMDHINSYKRKKLNNRSPYDAFSFYYGEEILEKLACRPVAAENIILKPRLLKK